MAPHPATAHTPVTDAVRDGAGDYLALVEELEESHTELLALVEQATRLFGGHSGRPNDPKTSIEVEQGFNWIDRAKEAVAAATGGAA